MYILQNVKLGNSNCVNPVFRLRLPTTKGFDYVGPLNAFTTVSFTEAGSI
jgi:hypothetical protein